MPQIRASLRRARALGLGRRLRNRRARDHDHRHLSQTRHPIGRNWRRADPHQRFLQGRRHDRARHGDDALLHFHRCRIPPGGVAKSAGKPRAHNVQLHDDRWRHLDQRHLSVICDGGGGKARSTRRRERARPQLADLRGALHDLLRDLAIQVAKDGEGLSKFVTIEIGGAESWEAARRIGLACANSPILKAAIFGEDPNWGRVVMAIGKSGEAADRDKLSIWFGPHEVARNGQRAPDYVERRWPTT